MSGWVLVVVVLGAVFLALPAAAGIAFEELLPGERPPRDRHMTFAGKLVDVLTVTGFMLTFSYLSVGLIFGSLASEPSVCEQLLTCTHKTESTPTSASHSYSVAFCPDCGTHSTSPTCGGGKDGRSTPHGCRELSDHGPSCGDSPTAKSS